MLLFSHFCRLMYFFFDLKNFFFIVQPIKTKNTVGGQGGGLFKFDAIQLIFLLAKLKKQWFAIIFFFYSVKFVLLFPQSKTYNDMPQWQQWRQLWRRQEEADLQVSHFFSCYLSLNKKGHQWYFQYYHSH